MNKLTPILFTGLLLALPAALQAEVKPSGLFSDHMVLQRECPVPVWATANPGEPVIVAYNVTDQQARLKGQITQGNDWHLKAGGGHVQIQVLVDRSSIEAFFDAGRACLVSTFYPDESNKTLELFSTGGNTRLISLDVYELGSAWDRPLRTASPFLPETKA